MLLFYYSIFDSKALCYSQPFLSINHDVAKRSFRDLANDRSSQIAKFPEDFSLFLIGTFDDQAGLMENVITNVNLGLASQFINYSE